MFPKCFSMSYQTRPIWHLSNRVSLNNSANTPRFNKECGSRHASCSIWKCHDGEEGEFEFLTEIDGALNELIGQNYINQLIAQYGRCTRWLLSQHLALRCSKSITMLSVYDILVRYHEALLRGLGVTLELTSIIWILGVVIGVFLGYLSARYRNAIGIPSRLIAFLLAGTPILVLLFWLYYPAQALFNVNIAPFWVACFALSVLNIFTVADLTRTTLNNFPNQYRVAALVCGLSPDEVFSHIEFPIVFRQILPNLLNIQVNMLQLTLFASLISVEEIFRVAQEINAQIYEPVQIYTTLAVFFLIICLPLNGLALWLKNRFTRDLSET